jgi:alpha-L-rhamnosidase
MNSFNHYAYGAVADWLYGVAAGIKPLKAGYGKIRIEPKPDKRLGWLCAYLKTRHGRVSVKWQYVEGVIRYDVETPVEAEICVGGEMFTVGKGTYTYYR